MSRPTGRDLLRHGLVVTLLLAWTFAIYGGTTLAVDAGFGHRGRAPIWVLLAATVVVAITLPNVRPWAERLANWLALGERADAYEIVTNFVSRVANAMSVDDVLPRLAETAARSVHSERGEVRLWLADGAEWRQVWPPDSAGASSASASSAVTVEVQHRGAAMGEIGVDAAGAGLAASDRRVLDELAGPLGLALSTVRNTFELRERLAQVAALNAELQASQQRLIEARRAEQHRLAGQVDEVVGPHLAATERTLLAAERAARTGAGDPASLLGAARTEATAALEALRQLARGIFPSLLSDAGVVAALQSWGEQSPVDLAVHAKGDLEAIRARPAAEAAVYFSCVTAVAALTGRRRAGPANGPAGSTAVPVGPANGPVGPVGHGGARATIEIDADDDGVRFTLLSAVDPERGPALPPATVQALRDRVEALGGTLDIEPLDGEMVTLDGWLPTTAERVGS